jgi:PAS domain S-box-containing protein
MLAIVGESSPRRLQQGLRLVSSVVQAFSETTADYSKLLDAIARRIAEAIPDMCILSLWDGTTLMPVSVHEVAGDSTAFHQILQRRFQPDEARLAAAVMSNGPVFMPEIDFDTLAAQAGEAATDRLRAVGARGMISVPLAFHGELHGVLTLLRHRAELPPLDELDFDILKDLGVHAALALSNARLFSRLEQAEGLRVAEQRAVQASQLVDAIVENIPDMVFVKEADNLSFVRFNRAGEALLGVQRDQLMGKNDYDFFPHGEAEFFVAKDRETLAKKSLVDIVEEPIQTSRGTRWLHTKKVPLLDADGTPRYLLGISEDITDRKHAELELRAAKAATDAANRELEAFAYSVAHDLRAPLRGIDGFSQALVEDFGDKLEGEGLRFLSRIRESAQRMADLIDDLLALSRVTRGELQRESVDLSVLATHAIARHRHAEPARRVDAVIAPGLVVQGDRRMMAIAIDNLIDNAWKFTANRAVAAIEVGCTSDAHPTYFVRDNGAGFEMEFVHKLFGVFQRLHTDAEFPGTGIGLVTVARIVERHGGRVWGEGLVDRGATFYLSLGES